MKRMLSLLLLSLVALFSLSAKDFAVRGPQGGISFKITVPDGFHPETDKCPMVILMHGIFASKDYNPMPAIAKGLARAGVASIRFDFGGHGNSEGKKQYMTIEKEIAEAMAIYEYVKTLPYVSSIGFLGHSQGGVIASMTAGRLAATGEAPKALALLAPGAVIKEACQGGKFLDARFNPQNPPEYVRCWGIFKLGREYLLSTQELDIYGTASAYKGKALILHGTADRTVPMWCSERYKTVYGDNAVFKIVAGENHTITRHRNEVVAEVVAFFKNELK